MRLMTGVSLLPQEKALRALQNALTKLFHFKAVQPAQSAERHSERGRSKPLRDKATQPLSLATPHEPLGGIARGPERLLEPSSVSLLDVKRLS